MTDQFLRQRNLFNPDDFKDLAVTVIGTGSVGSFATLSLAKMGIPKLVIWDPDKIEEHNISNQFVTNNSLNMWKVDEVKGNISRMSNAIIFPNRKKFSKTSTPTEIVISTVDSMKARNDIWKVLKASDVVRLYIDARVGGENFRIYCVNPHDKKDIDYYEDNLDLEDSELPCGERTIIYNVLATSAFICSLLKKFLRGGKVPKMFAMDSLNLASFAKE